MATITYEETDESGDIVRIVTGNNRPEELIGRSLFSDSIYGRGGDDIIEGRGLSDELNGDDGNDIISGGDGYDYLFGGAGDDVLNQQANGGWLDGGAGNDRCYGGDGQDEFWGEDGNDRFGGHAGDDRGDGGRGNDVMYGDEGWDGLDGESGNDVIDGGGGDDRLDGGKGNDQVQGGRGSDNLAGGSGNDLILADAGDELTFTHFADASRTIGEDTVQGGEAPWRLNFAVLCILDDGREARIDMASFLDASGNGVITAADLWVTRDEEDNLIVDVSGILEEVTGGRPEERQRITFEGMADVGLDADLVPTLLQRGIEYGTPVALWDGNSVEIREPDF